MSIHLAALSITKATVLCIGGITREEAENAQVDGNPVDGSGYYLFLADEGAPKQPIQILEPCPAVLRQDGGWSVDR